MNPINIAVIGAGHLGKIHARLLDSQPDVNVIAVAELNQSARENFAQQSDLPVVEDYRGLIPEIDAAVVATPTRTHFAIASELLENGIHVLVEKPLTDSVNDARRLVEMARKNHCTVQVGHVERFNASIECALLQIGQPRFIMAERMSGYTFRSTDIGVVHDLMIHDIDLVNSMFKGTLEGSQANGISMFGGNEDIAHARLQFSCGGVANLTASRCSFNPSRKIQMFGTEGYARIDLATHQVESVRVPSWIREREMDFFALTPKQQAFIRENLFDKVLPIEEENVEPVNAILAEQSNWIDCIRSGETPRVSVEQGTEAVEIAESVLQQIRGHHWFAGNDVASHGAFPDLPMAWSKPDSVPEQLRPAAPIRRAA